jgi:hypothetical protein
MNRTLFSPPVNIPDAWLERVTKRPGCGSDQRPSLATGTTNIDPLRNIEHEYWNNWETVRHLLMFNAASVRDFVARPLDCKLVEIPKPNRTGG